jgi:hypothetical protein
MSRRGNGPDGAGPFPEVAGAPDDPRNRPENLPLAP